MQQLWTVIFVMLLVAGWGLAAWHDREEARRQQRKVVVNQTQEDG